MRNAFHRHYRYEQKLARLLWKVEFKDILTLPETMEYSPYNYQERVSCLYANIIYGPFYNSAENSLQYFKSNQFLSKK